MPSASIYVVSAIAGCQQWESSLNPNIWESNSPQTWDTIWNDDAGYGVGGYGLGQWTNVRFSNGTVSWRLRDMHDWCVANNKDITNGNSQLEYLIHENVWFNVSHVGSNAQTLTEFLESNSTNLDGLVEDFLANWEGVPGNQLATRIRYAHDIFDHIRANENVDPSTISWQSSSTWVLPLSETMNNALCYYFYFQGYDPGGGPSIKKNGMPLWMMLKRMRHF